MTLNVTDWIVGGNETKSFQDITSNSSEFNGESYFEAKEMRDNIKAYLKRKKDSQSRRSTSLPKKARFH